MRRITSLDHSIRIIYMYNILGSLSPPRLLLQLTYCFSGVTALLCFLLLWQLISASIFSLTHSLRPLLVLPSSDFRLLDLYLYRLIPRSSSRLRGIIIGTTHATIRANKQPTLVCLYYIVHTAVRSPILLFAFLHRTNERAKHDPPRPPNAHLPCSWSLNYLQRIPYLPCDISIPIQRLLFPAFRHRPCHT
jgi:hypothetical protein